MDKKGTTKKTTTAAAGNVEDKPSDDERSTKQNVQDKPGDDWAGGVKDLETKTTDKATTKAGTKQKTREDTSDDDDDDDDEDPTSKATMMTTGTAEASSKKATNDKIDNDSDNEDATKTDDEDLSKQANTLPEESVQTPGKVWSPAPFKFQKKVIVDIEVSSDDDDSDDEDLSELSDKVKVDPDLAAKAEELARKLHKVQAENAASENTVVPAMQVQQDHAQLADGALELAEKFKSYLVQSEARQKQEKGKQEEENAQAQYKIAELRRDNDLLQRQIDWVLSKHRQSGNWKNQYVAIAKDYNDLVDRFNKDCPNVENLQPKSLFY